VVGDLQRENHQSRLEASHTPSTFLPAHPTGDMTEHPKEVWANNLWPHMHSNQLLTALINNTRITVVSNAAVHNNGQAMCAWIIWAQQELWSGEGYIPSKHDAMNSGLAEAYGMATILGFLNHMYPIILSFKWKIYVYCDNQGVIECISNQGGTPYTWDTISDDYPFYTEIQ